MKRVVLLATVLLGLPVLAADYRIVDRGGPLTLTEDVAAAVAAWRSAAEGDLALAEDPTADRVIRFGDPERFGPDTVSLTVQRQGGDLSLEVLLDPAGYRDHPTTLLHEIGLLLGVGSGTEGVMRPALGADAPTEPTEVDVLALQAAASVVAGDITRDGVVDFDDLVALGAAYGQRGVNLAADLDGDGEVGDGDLAVLRENYTFSPPERPEASEGEPADAVTGGVETENVEGEGVEDGDLGSGGADTGGDEGGLGGEDEDGGETSGGASPPEGEGSGSGGAEGERAPTDGDTGGGESGGASSAP